MIILAGTPIGNLGDASARLIDTFKNATLVACEDTRSTAKLLGMLGVENRPRLVALHEHNEDELAKTIVEQARDSDVVLVSDAGMPGISDPGYPIVALAAKEGVTVTSVPGPSAVITALAISGLPTDRFTFDGFRPARRGSARRSCARSRTSRARSCCSSRRTAWPGRSPTWPRSGMLTAASRSAAS